LVGLGFEAEPTTWATLPLSCPFVIFGFIRLPVYLCHTPSSLSLHANHPLFIFQFLVSIFVAFYFISLLNAQ
jgi:hypothetical protein